MSPTSPDIDLNLRSLQNCQRAAALWTAQTAPLTTQVLASEGDPRDMVPSHSDTSDHCTQAAIALNIDLANCFKRCCKGVNPG